MGKVGVKRLQLSTCARRVARAVGDGVVAVRSVVGWRGWGSGGVVRGRRRKHATRRAEEEERVSG